MLYMKLPLYNQQGEEVGEIILPEDVFGLKINRDLMHQAVVAQMSNSRQTLAHAKKRGEVRGGGKKPWRQKGTGRARHSSIRSPIWVGGGVVFGPTKERNFSKKINKKMKRKALFMGLSGKFKDNQITVLDKIEITRGKTKEVTDTIRALNKRFGEEKNQTILMVLPKKDELTKRASSNIKKVKTILADSLNIIDILTYKYLVLTRESIDIIKKFYAV